GVGADLDAVLDDDAADLWNGKSLDTMPRRDARARFPVQLFPPLHMQPGLQSGLADPAAAVNRHAVADQRLHDGGPHPDRALAANLHAGPDHRVDADQRAAADAG